MVISALAMLYWVGKVTGGTMPLSKLDCDHCFGTAFSSLEMLSLYRSDLDWHCPPGSSSHRAFHPFWLRSRMWKVPDWVTSSSKEYFIKTMVASTLL